jgi:hypothetical protein
MKASLFTLLASCAAAALLAGCASAPEAEASWVVQARGVAGAVPPKLLSVLQDEIARSGPEGAIGACNEKAPAMARAASEQSGWAIRRVSLRNRNPKAVPDAWERAVLEDFDRRAAAHEPVGGLERSELVKEADGRSVQRYMRALPTIELCTQCHGQTAQMKPAVLARLQAMYPNDRAVGYAPGDIRGAITLRRSVP